MADPVDWAGLRQAAAAVRQHAHAPYSNFRVGAALLTSEGHVIVGANVENGSYGLTQCAERSAVTAAVATGARQFRALALITQGPAPVTPCGACRQVLAEFPPSFEVRCYTVDGEEAIHDTAQLLPDAFKL